MSETMLDAALERACSAAIAKVGVAAFRRTSLFGSNQKAAETLKTAA